MKGVMKGLKATDRPARRGGPTSGPTFPKSPGYPRKPQGSPSAGRGRPGKGGGNFGKQTVPKMFPKPSLAKRIPRQKQNAEY